MIECRLLPLDVDSFFDFKWGSCGGWSKMLKHSSEQRVQHCWKFGKCLKLWEVTDQVLTYDKCREVSPKYWALQLTYKNLWTSRVGSPLGIVSFIPNLLPILKDEKKLNIYVITITLSKVANPFLRDNRKKYNVVKVIWNKSSAQCLKRKPGGLHLLRVSVRCWWKADF